MLYELVLNLQYLGNKFVNRWNYISSEEGVSALGAFGLVQALGLFVTGDPVNFPVDTLGAAIQAILNSQTIFVQTYCKNVYEPLDFYDYAFVADTVGGDAGAGLSPVNAIAATSTRTRTDIRRGQKRFGGISADWATNGGGLTTEALTKLQTVCDRMSEDVSYNNGVTVVGYTPVVVGKQKVTDSEGKVSYQYYSTLAAQMDHVALAPVWSPKTNIRTQGSRQYGRGQ